MIGTVHSQPADMERFRHQAVRGFGGGRPGAVSVAHHPVDAPEGQGLIADV
jgi:hypothetical protein